jgi:hypothetical protein
MSIKLARKEKGVEYLSRALENGAVKAPRLGSAFRIKIFAEGAHFTRKIQKFPIQLPKIIQAFGRKTHYPE